MTGFKAETETGVKSAFAGIGKLTAGLFVVGGAVEGLKKVAEAASADQAAFAVLEKTVENAGAATTVYGHTIEDLIKQQAKLRGFNDEELASSFVRLVSATHDSAKAYKDLGLAEDVARARHIGVAQAAIAISKAEQGVTTALQRLGIVVRPVTANVDALKASHDQATAAGVKFTKQQDAQYKSLLAQAKAQDQVASRANTISIIQQRFGGSAATFANTAAGAWARLHEQVHLFAEFLGAQALPELTSAGIKVGDFFQRLSSNQNLRQGIGQTLDLIKTSAEALGPPLATAARLLGAVTSAVGVPALVAGVVAFKAFGAAVNLARAAQASWIALQARITGAKAADAAETKGLTASEALYIRTLEASTVALAENTAALTANAGAAGRLNVIRGVSTASAEAATVANEALTASELEVGAAGASAGAGGLLTGLGGLVNEVTLTAVGVAALAAGLVYLGTRESALSRQNRETADSFKTLGDAVARAEEKRRAAAEARARIAPDKTAVAQARLEVQAQQQALATSMAPRASIQYQQQVLAVTSAVQQYRSALKQLADDQRHVGATEQQAANAARARAAATATAARNAVATAGRFREQAQQPDAAFIRQRDQLRQHAEELRNAADKMQAALGGQAATSPAIAAQIQELNREADAAKRAADVFAASEVVKKRTTAETTATVASFAREMAKLAEQEKSQSPLVAHNTALLGQFATALGRVPTRHETKIILDNRDAKASLQDLISKDLPADFAALAKSMFDAGQNAMASFADGAKIGFGPALVEVVTQFQAILGAAGAAGRKGSADQAHTAAVATAKTLANAATVAETAAKNAAAGLASARENLSGVSASAKDAIDSAAQGVKNAQDNLAQVIANGKTQINSAVLSAKQNLQSIGQRLASDIQQFLDKQGQKAGPLTGPAAKEFAKLSELIKHGGGTVDIERRAQSLASDLEGLAAKRAQKSTTGLTVQEHIDDLVNAFEKGPQNAASVKRLQNAIAKLMHVDHVTRRAVAKQFGTAFADDLFAQFRGVGQQATAQVRGPHRPGTGQEPSIVRPEQTVIQVSRDIARAQQELGNQQLTEAKAQTEQLKLIATATKKVAAATKTSKYATTAAGKAAEKARIAAAKVKIK